MRKGFFADVFSGCGVVARHIRQLGFGAREFDIRNSPSQDATKPELRRWFLTALRLRILLGLMLAPPCSSFSIARNRTLPIRSTSEPWGKQGILMSDNDTQKILEGNKLARFCLCLMKAAFKHNVPWILEHPTTSDLWHAP